MSQWWDDEFEVDKPAPKTNQSAPVRDCQTCGGDRFVTVRLRSPEITQWMSERLEKKGIRPRPDEFHEEVAPCPSCNAGCNYDYWVFGKQVRTPDAQWVREAIRQ